MVSYERNEVPSWHSDQWTLWKMWPMPLRCSLTMTPMRSSPPSDEARQLCHTGAAIAHRYCGLEVQHLAETYMFSNFHITRPEGQPGCLSSIKFFWCLVVTIMNTRAKTVPAVMLESAAQFNMLRPTVWKGGCDGPDGPHARPRKRPWRPWRRTISGRT
jgi:hypothetical protein